jgi:hypothetical protein
MDDLKERLRADAEWCAERVAVTPRQIGRDCEEALTYIETLEQHVSELEGLCKEALAFVERTEARNMRFDVGYGVFTKVLVAKTICSGASFTKPSTGSQTHDE